MKIEKGEIRMSVARLRGWGSCGLGVWCAGVHIGPYEPFVAGGPEGWGSSAFISHTHIAD